MKNAQYKAIGNPADVQEFQNISNGLHDGYITRVAYVNNGISSLDHGYAFDSAARSLLIHVLVTSLPGEPVFELVFQGVSEWQINEIQFSDITGFSILFLEHGMLLWADDDCPDLKELKQGCYVVAESIQYRQL